jgi:hypothetical protein
VSQSIAQVADDSLLPSQASMDEPQAFAPQPIAPASPASGLPQPTISSRPINSQETPKSSRKTKRQHSRIDQDENIASLKAEIMMKQMDVLDAQKRAADEQTQAAIAKRVHHRLAAEKLATEMDIGPVELQEYYYTQFL